MPDFNQAALDAHLAEMSANLTPEQAEQFQRNVRQRIASSNIDLSSESVDGAFDLLAAIGNAGTDATGLSDKIGGVLSSLDPRGISIGMPNVDLGGKVGDVLGGVSSGFGKLFGGASGIKDATVGNLGGAVHKAGDALTGLGNLGSSAVDKVGDAAGGAMSMGANAISKAGDVAGSAMSAGANAIGKAGDLAGGLRGVGESGMSAAGDLAGSAGDIAGSAGGAIADLVGSAAGSMDVASGAADLAGAVLGALGDVLGSLTDL